MIYTKTLADVYYERMRGYQRHLAVLRFYCADYSPSSPFVRATIKQIKFCRNVWKAARDETQMESL